MDLSVRPSKFPEKNSMIDKKDEITIPADVTFTITDGNGNSQEVHSSELNVAPVETYKSPEQVGTVYVFESPVLRDLDGDPVLQVQVVQHLNGRIDFIDGDISQSVLAQSDSLEPSEYSIRTDLDENDQA